MQLRGLFGLAVMVLVAGTSAQSSNMKLQYISPAPGSSVASGDVHIAIRPGGLINRHSLPEDPTLEAVGSLSGKHSGDLLLSDDLKTLVYIPRTPFVPGETVTVSLRPGFPGLAKGHSASFSFSFTVAQLAVKPQVNPKMILGKLKVVPEPERHS